jgi:hypothetical protein
LRKINKQGATGLKAASARLGPSFSSLTNFLMTALNKFSWAKVMLMYDRLGQDNVVELFCNLAANGLHVELKR